MHGNEPVKRNLDSRRPISSVKFANEPVLEFYKALPTVVRKEEVSLYRRAARRDTCATQTILEFAAKA